MNRKITPKYTYITNLDMPTGCRLQAVSVRTQMKEVTTLSGYSSVPRLYLCAFFSADFQVKRDCSQSLALR